MSTKMQRLFSLMMAVLTMLSLTACGGNATSSTPASAVSYTHLDVYKRQSQRFSVSIGLNNVNERLRLRYGTEALSLIHIYIGRSSGGFRCADRILQ